MPRDKKPVHAWPVSTAVPHARPLATLQVTPALPRQCLLQGQPDRILKWCYGMIPQDFSQQLLKTAAAVSRRAPHTCTCPVLQAQKPHAGIKTLLAPYASSKIQTKARGRRNLNRLLAVTDMRMEEAQRTPPLPSAWSAAQLTSPRPCISSALHRHYPHNTLL